MCARPNCSKGSVNAPPFLCPVPVTDEQFHWTLFRVTAIMATFMMSR